MAEKGWTTQAATAAGISAGAGTAQLGLGYGLGVIAWPMTPAAAESVWLGSLGWATWITASATMLGAVIAGRLRTEQGGRWRGFRRFSLAAAAALGALVSVALVALPARSAVHPGTLSPQLVASGYAVAGLIAGLIIAFWAVSSSPVAANLIGTAAWLWALAVAGVAVELASGRDLATYLTSWQFAESIDPVRYGGIYWPSALLTLVAAFGIGLVASWPAARRGNLGLSNAISGAVGPLLVAFSFLILAPQLTEALGPLQSAYLIAPYAVLAGLGGSAVTVTLTRRRDVRSGLRSEPAAPGPTAPALPPAPEPVPPAPAAPAPAPRARGRKAAAAESAVPAEKPTVERPVTEKPPAETPATENPAPAKPADGKPGKGGASGVAEDESTSEWLRSLKNEPGNLKEGPSPLLGLKEEPAKEASPKPLRGLFSRKTATSDSAPKTPIPTNAPPQAPAPVNPPPAPRPAPAKATPARMGNVTAPTDKNDKSDKVGDPEIAAAARKSSGSKRPPPRKSGTITPPPANPAVARINPKNGT
ncbi:Hansenula MRAKII killer toxin-resistant protein 1 [Actinoplanes sp. NBRC 101535]|uniref:Hansenula MRAKII killer toxin-resistant protein 1 n=1 Tax=Actinoplanes sp. NBRC 101535 TaxID=3032196 RepID=UPI0024A17770|nr:Hansenula MRAKII killer toxin-resistant protein 1 [Actinoplanes sp. NBRC 101535]GLY07287.1 hypothetical protein Acsp01_76660 [Actinoplanes sp. NBRC 101535]